MGTERGLPHGVRGRGRSPAFLLASLATTHPHRGLPGPVLTARPSGRRLARGRQGCDARYSPGPAAWPGSEPNSSGPAPVHGPAQLLQLSSSALEMRVQGPTLLRQRQHLSPSRIALFCSTTASIYLLDLVSWRWNGRLVVALTGKAGSGSSRPSLVISQPPAQPSAGRQLGSTWM